MDDPFAEEVARLRLELAFLSRTRADLYPNKVAVYVCAELMYERFARLEELKPLRELQRRGEPAAQRELRAHRWAARLFRRRSA